MELIHLRPYQVKAVEAIQAALERDQMYIVVEMPVGVGKSVVLAKTLEMLSKRTMGKILVVVGNNQHKKIIESDLPNRYQGFVQLDESKIVVETEESILKHKKDVYSEYCFAVLYNTSSNQKIRDCTSFNDKQIVAFSTYGQKIESKDYFSNDIVFSYSLNDAIYEGVLTPAMDAEVLDPAVYMFRQYVMTSHL